MFENDVVNGMVKVIFILYSLKHEFTFVGSLNDKNEHKLTIRIVVCIQPVIALSTQTHTDTLKHEFRGSSCV